MYRFLDEVYELSFDPESNVYSCSQCSISFADVDEHLKEFHAENEGDDCDMVEVVVNPLETVEEEYEEIDGIAIVMKTEDSRFKCDGCEKSFKSIKRFVDHLKTHGTVYQDQIDELEKGISPDEPVQNWEEVYCDDDPEKVCYKCLECNTILNSRKSFLLHYKIHTNRRKMASKTKKVSQSSLHCSLCNKSMANQNMLDMHMKAHSENLSHQSRKPYNPAETDLPNQVVKNKLACQYCDKVFKRPIEKVKHERV